MAELKSIKFPGLDEVYEVAQTDKELENAKATGGIGWEDTTEITWDGNPDGHVVVGGDGETVEGYVKVSDVTPALADVLGGRVFIVKDGAVTEAEITEEQGTMMCSGLLLINGGAAVVVYEDNYSAEGGDLTFPEHGLYFVTTAFSHPDDFEYCSKMFYNARHKIDEKYLPEQDLSAYRTSVAQDEIDATKQDKLVAGTNITIAEDGKTISADSVEIDNQTIIKGEDGKIKTAVGGMHVEKQAFEYTWDGNTEGRTIITIGGYGYAKVSNDIISPYNLRGGYYRVAGDSDYYRWEENEIPNLKPLYNGYLVIDADAAVITVPSPSIPETGIYFGYYEDEYTSALGQKENTSGFVPIPVSALPTSIPHQLLYDAGRFEQHTTIMSWEEFKAFDNKIRSGDYNSVLFVNESLGNHVLRLYEGSYANDTSDGVKVYGLNEIVIFDRSVEGYTVEPFVFGTMHPQPYMCLKSATPNSSKVFTITVDDNGTLSATEVTT